MNNIFSAISDVSSIMLHSLKSIIFKAEFRLMYDLPSYQPREVMQISISIRSLELTEDHNCYAANDSTAPFSMPIFIIKYRHYPCDSFIATDGLRYTIILPIYRTNEQEIYTTYNINHKYWVVPDRLRVTKWISHYIEMNAGEH